MHRQSTSYPQDLSFNEKVVDNREKKEKRDKKIRTKTERKVHYIVDIGKKIRTKTERKVHYIVDIGNFPP